MTASPPTLASDVNMAGNHTLFLSKDYPGFSKFAADAIDLKAFEFTVGHGAEGSSGEKIGSGRLSLSGVTITKNVDKSTPLFFQALTQNSTIKEIGIFLYRNGPKDGKPENWFTITLTNATVANQRFIDADKEKGGEAAAVEELIFHAEKIEVSHNPAKKVASYQFTAGGKVS
jgi:type VI secretion system Hcp family effector